MGKSSSVLFIVCAFWLWAPVVGAQEQVEDDFDYDAAIEDIPIESEVYGPDLTYTDDSGFEATLYG